MFIVIFAVVILVAIFIIIIYAKLKLKTLLR